MGSNRGALKNLGGDDCAAVIPLRPSEEQLLRMLQAGQGSAAGQLYDLYERDIHRLAWRLLGRDTEHDDVVHEIFVQVLRSVDQVKDAARLRQWIMGVGVNVVRQTIRKRVRFRLLFPLDVEPEEPEGVTSDPSASRLLERVYAVLERMPADLRIAFVLRHIEGHGLSSIAELCSCSRSTIERRLRRADEYFRSAARRDPELAARLTEKEAT